MSGIGPIDRIPRERAETATHRPPAKPVNVTGLGGIDPSGSRVSVGEKAMINARDDLKQLLPLKYHWAWEKYLAGCTQP